MKGLGDLIFKRRFRHLTAEDATAGICVPKDDPRYERAPYESFRALSKEAVKADGAELPFAKRFLI